MERRSNCASRISAGRVAWARRPAWALVGDQDNTGEEGYERTRTANGRHYYELWESAQGRGEQAVLLGERITVSVSGHPANASTLGTALNEVDIAGLERLVRP